MAIKIYEKFAPRANPADGDYPYGSIKNESVPGAKDGTPLDAAWGNDYAGTDAELFAQAGIVPNGQPDKLGASQRVNAINRLIARNQNNSVALNTWSDVDYTVAPHQAVKDNSGIYWVRDDNLPFDIISEPNIAGGWRPVGLLNGHTMFDSRNWTSGVDTPSEITRKLQMCLDAYARLDIFGQLAGDGALVARGGYRISGVTGDREQNNYRNSTLKRATIGEVIAPEAGGSTDNYNVIADLLIVAPASEYCNYVSLKNVSFGIGGLGGCEYNIFAPRMAFFSMDNVRMVHSTVAGFYTLCTFTSVFTRGISIPLPQGIGWQFGREDFIRHAPVSMTSNTFSSCGAVLGRVGWLIQHAVYSSFTSCYAEGQAAYIDGNDSAWKIIDGKSLVLQNCGSENLKVPTIVIKSSEIFLSDSSISIKNFNHNNNGSYTDHRWVDISGVVTVNIDGLMLTSPLASPRIEIRTVDGCLVTLNNIVGVTGSDPSSNARLKFLDYSVSFVGKPVTGELTLWDDGPHFKNGVAAFHAEYKACCTVSAKNISRVSRQLVLRLTPEDIVAQYIQDVPAGAWACTSLNGALITSKGAQAKFFVEDFMGNFEFTLGQGGMSANVV